MAFNRENSLKEILQYPNMEEYLKVFYSRSFRDYFMEEQIDLPLCQVEKMGKSPRDEEFSIVVQNLLLAVDLICQLQEKGEKRAVLLWGTENEEWNPLKEGFETHRKEDVFLIAPRRPVSESGRKPAVIICPGGGYESVSCARAGAPVMQRMEEAGYVAFLLRYRVAPARFPQPQQDLDMALRHVRAHAEFYGIDPENVMAMGFSAGGHLCGSTALYSQSPPDKLCLGYPVISLSENTHSQSAENLTGGDRELKVEWSLENRITADYPKTFIWTMADDTYVPPDNTLRMMMALDRAKVTYQGHIYSTGNHGCGLAIGTSAEGWVDVMLSFMAE